MQGLNYYEFVYQKNKLLRILKIQEFDFKLTKFQGLEKNIVFCLKILLHCSFFFLIKKI